jgi:hypothetical protein
MLIASYFESFHIIDTIASYKNPIITQTAKEMISFGKCSGTNIQIHLVILYINKKNTPTGHNDIAEYYH